jgi:hypothetical protein
MTLEPTSPASLVTTSEAGGEQTRRQGDKETRRKQSLFALLVSLSPCLLVCVLAFLLASTPARNSDVWLHLASGRLLAEGRSPRAPEPFTSSAAGAAWVNHSWLADMALYRLYELDRERGRALALAKAAAVALLAGLLFCFRRRGTPMGLFALAAAAAVLALGPWLLLQPVLLSLLGVVLTLYLLERPSLVEEDRAGRARAQRWLLVPLFALWANLDGWFVLGPALLGLYALGELLRCPAGGPRGELRALGLLTLAGLAACLLTPYHYHTFAWPAPLGLWPAERALMGDPLGRGLVVSPFGARFMASVVFASPGAWAYYLLLAAGLASFALCGRALHLGRLLAWLALAALSAYQARAIPFFAVAAGPVLALNLQEWALLRQTRRQGDKETRRQKRPFLLLVSLSPCLLVLLPVLAWPGWLQPRPWQPRRWAVEPDGSLVRLADHLRQWHADRAFREGRFALTFSPEAAHYLAWACPAEKGFFDSRWPLFGRTADDYVRMRRCLLQSDAAGPGPELGPLLDAHHLDRIILYDPDWDSMTRAYRCLLQARPEWELLALDGTAALFGRRSGAPSPSAWEGLDPRRAAYQPGPDGRAPLTAPRAPQPAGTFASFYRPQGGRSPDQGEAALHLIAYDLAAARTQADLSKRWLLAQAAGLVGLGPAGPAGARALRLHLTPLFPDPSAVPLSSPTATAGGSQAADLFEAGFLALHDRGPPAELLLAVRAARRALAANPDDGGAYLLLGEAYLRLANRPGARRWQAVLPSLADIRQAQVLTALEQAALLRPDLDQPHALLAPLYYDLGQWDRALDHLRARLRIAEREARGGGPKAREAAERREALQARVETMDALVERALRTYEANIAGKTDPSKVYDRALVAVRHRLTRKALEMLLESDYAIFGKAGAQLQLNLMLQCGRAFEVRDWLKPGSEAVLGFKPYHWLRAKAAAACGDYAALAVELDALGGEFRHAGLSKTLVVPVRPAMAFHVASAVLARPALGSGPAALAWALRTEFESLQPLPGLAGLLTKGADLSVMRGLLALEPGDVEAAGKHVRAALEVWGDDACAASGAGLDFPARPLAQQILRRLEGAEETRPGPQAR